MMGIQQLSRTIDPFPLVVLLTTVLSTLIYCQINHDSLPQGDKDMMRYVREMLNGSERLVLFAGVNGAMKDDLICWTSKEKTETYPTFHHYIYFWKNESKGTHRNLTPMYRLADYSVGPKGGIPSIYLLAKDEGGEIDEGLSGDYILLGANSTCFVMGVIEPKKLHVNGLHPSFDIVFLLTWNIYNVLLDLRRPYINNWLDHAQQPEAY
nr:uncharacterized protein LOC119179142 [Rhipicephalus microplus]